MLPFTCVLTLCYGALDLLYVCTKSPLMWTSIMVGAHLPGMLCTQSHGCYFPYGAFVHRAILQNQVNSVMPLGMLLPAWCPRTTMSRASQQESAVGEHLGSQLMVELCPVSLKLVLIPTPSVSSKLFRVSRWFPTKVHEVHLALHNSSSCDLASGGQVIEAPPGWARRTCTERQRYS